MNVIETQRLILRTWSEKDAEDYFRINQDPKVLEFLRGPLTMQQVQDFIHFVNEQFNKIGFTLWACQEKSSGKLMGFIGLDPLKWDAPFGPCVEIGWRLGSEFWGKGYATEGAQAALDYGFKHCGLKEVVSFTVPANKRSLRVMEKIGMHRDLTGDFNHPKLPPNHPLSKHVLYRITKEQCDKNH